MATNIRAGAALAFVVGLGLPAGAQGERCTADALLVDGTPVAARFCVPSAPTPAGVTVSESFTARGGHVTKTLALVVVPGARTSRGVDDVDLAPIGVPRTLHVTLAYRAGQVELEHALALPGAVPVK